MGEKNKIINIAVIAHVDAGKSTLVDALLAQSHVLRDNGEGAWNYYIFQKLLYHVQGLQD